MLKINGGIQFVVHSPALLGILFYPDTNYFKVHMTIYKDSTAEFYLEPDYELQNIKWITTNLESLAKKHTNISNVNISGDTLQIISTSDELYYPFGTFRSVNNFELKHSNLYNKIPEYFKNNTGKNDTLYCMKRFSSYIRMLNIDSSEDEDEDNKMEIVSAEISDPKIVFSNGIRVGLSKKRFLNHYFKKVKGLKNIKIIVMESSLTGIWQYYFFEKDILKSIKIKTDFQINQN